MKRFGKVLLSLIAVVILLAGCEMKETMGFEIKSDKTVKMVVTVGYDKEMIDNIISMDGETSKEDITDEMRWKTIGEQFDDLDGATKTKYNKDGWYGYVYSKDAGTLDSLSTTNKNAKRVDINDPDKMDKMFIKDGDKYKSILYMDVTNDDDLENIDQYESYGAKFDISFEVTLPVKPLSHNATEVSDDGKTLKWDLLKTKNIDFEFDLSNEPVTEPTTTTTQSVETTTTAESTTKKADDNNNEKEGANVVLIVIIAVVGFVLLLIVIIIVILIIVLSSKKKAAPVEQPVQPVETQPTETTVESTSATEEVKPEETTDNK